MVLLGKQDSALQMLLGRVQRIISATSILQNGSSTVVPALRRQVSEIIKEMP